jgi:hypothetical protein
LPGEGSTQRSRSFVWYGSVYLITA